MSTLAKWQSFARSNGLKGWSRLKKYELVDFLVQNLWSGGGGLDEPKMNKAAKLKIRKYKKNPLVKKNPAIKVPILNPGKRSVFRKAIPKKIEENVENVVDWAKWLESVKDAEIRKKSTPAVEKLKKQIAELWEKNLLWKKANPLLENSQDNSSFAGMILFPPKSFSGKQEGK